MASITLKKIPDRLHRDFKRRALANRRSLQAEIILTLEQSLGADVGADALDVGAVAGMLKPRRKGVSVDEMKTAVETEFRKQWKRY